MTTKIHTHTKDKCPVAANKNVSYNTISRDGKISHWHRPIEASYINWSAAEFMGIGRVYQYRVVK